jgi:tripartite-type tricarboxylate transporter receptor subunit TctC
VKPGHNKETQMKVLRMMLAGCALAALGMTAAAQTYPSKPIRLIVTFPAGGGADFMGRLIGQKLSESFGQSVIIDNRAGAGGAIGNEAVAKAPADGYSLLLGAAGALVIAHALYAKLPFDTVKDFAPIALLGHVQFAVVTHPSIPARSTKELIALARANPGKLNFGSSGNGGAPHLAGELFKSMAKIEMVHVPYKGLAAAITDLIGGQLEVLFADLNLVQPHIQTRRLRGLAVTGDKRSALMPDLPTVAESALPGYQAGTWYGVLAPAGTPREIIVRLNNEINRILGSNDIKERFATQGAERANVTPEQFAAYIRSELDKWAKVVKAANIKVE